MAEEKRPEYRFEPDNFIFTTNSAEYLSFKPDEFWCEKCKKAVTTILQLHFGDPYIDGDYCQVCWARWIKEYVPRVKRIEKTNGNGRMI